jgi:hypothetical protein
MNPSVVSSKRFVVSEADFETLKKEHRRTGILD